MSKPNPSPNTFPKLFERFSARFQQKEGGRFPLLLFDETQICLMRPVLCYGAILRFFETSPFLLSHYKLDLRSYGQLFVLVYLAFKLCFINLRSYERLSYLFDVYLSVYLSMYLSNYLSINLSKDGWRELLISMPRACLFQHLG